MAQLLQRCIKGALSGPVTTKALLLATTIYSPGFSSTSVEGKMSTEAFSETLQFITNVKLNELDKRNDKFVQLVSQVITDANAYADIDPIARLSVFVDGLKAWPGARSDDFSLVDIKRYLEQARCDPGFPPSVIEEWSRKAQAQFDHETTRFDFARLFGMLLNDWLKSSSSSSQVTVAAADGTARDQTSSPEAFEKISRKETIEQKEKLESLIFEERKIDVVALKTYLKGLFSTKEAAEELEILRTHVNKFGRDLRGRTITTSELKEVIQSVLQTNVLSEEKQATLKEFLRNPTVMKELASVLNMQLSTIKSWSWPMDGVVLEPRRHLNGRTRFHLDTEILTCLLLHFLGILWSVEFKEIFNSLLNSRIWKRSPRKLGRVDRKRRDIFYGKEDTYDSIDKLRRKHETDHFFMCQLPSEFNVTTDNYKDDADEEDYVDNFWLVKDSDYSHPHFDSPVELKQSLLHILSADITLCKALHEKCTVVRTDLEWFGPSLPFVTIMTVLEFFGMPEENINFMEAFLSCPVMFKDDPSRQVRLRKRGVPISYMLSTLFGELVMFIMDFAVNQRADGLFLHRIHDDFWFWDADSTRCAAAWTEMQRYAAVAGLTFNLEKTGSVAIGEDVLHNDLPCGDVRWGFLRMDAASNGRFVVDQAMVDNHITELRRQLSATTSVFGWIQAYNKYNAFIVRNCGSPAIVYGKKHIDDIIDTLTRVQRTLFSAEAGDADQGSFVTAVAKMIEDKFGVPTKEIPYGWYLWPNAAGGLEVKDPLVNLFLVRNGYEGRSVDGILRHAYLEDEWRYELAKRRWEGGETGERTGTFSMLPPLSVPGERDVVSPSEPFFSFEESTKGREECGYWWCDAYKKLLERPKRCEMVCTPQLEASLKLLGDGVNAFGGAKLGVTSGWGTLPPYWQWIIALHHDEMVKKFGSLAVVEPKSVPVGMVSVFKGSRMKWEQ